MFSVPSAPRLYKEQQVWWIQTLNCRLTLSSERASHVKKRNCLNIISNEETEKLVAAPSIRGPNSQCGGSYAGPSIGNNTPLWHSPSGRQRHWDTTPGSEHDWSASSLLPDQSITDQRPHYSRISAWLISVLTTPGSASFVIATWHGVLWATDTVLKPQTKGERQTCNSRTVR
jgi:hypothetical protein